MRRIWSGAFLLGLVTLAGATTAADSDSLFRWRLSIDSKPNAPTTGEQTVRLGPWTCLLGAVDLKVNNAFNSMTESRTLTCSLSADMSVETSAQCGRAINPEKESVVPHGEETALLTLKHKGTTNRLVLACTPR
jgi:hypothetical protein